MSSHVTISKVTPAYWRVTFDHPPINTITLDTIRGLRGVVDAAEPDPEVRVVVFDSANPGFFLAHYGVGEPPEDPTPFADGPTGLDPFLDVYTRLSRLPPRVLRGRQGSACWADRREPSPPRRFWGRALPARVMR